MQERITSVINSILLWTRSPYRAAASIVSSMTRIWRVSCTPRRRRRICHRAHLMHQIRRRRTTSCRGRTRSISDKALEGARRCLNASDFRGTRGVIGSPMASPRNLRAQLAAANTGTLDDDELFRVCNLLGIRSDGVFGWGLYSDI